MKKRLKDYIKYMDEILKKENIYYEEEIKKHLIQISFFQHERLIHLIVTGIFAIMTLIIFLYALTYTSLMIIILTGLFLILLVPYIRHYYILENGVQYMYKQYDKLIEMKKTKSHSSL